MRGKHIVVTLVLGVIVVGCGYRVRVGEHGGRSSTCAVDADCAAGDQCECGHCISLEILPPACNPPCALASPGDWCDVEGARCDAAACSSKVCSSGTWQLEIGTCDGGTCGCSTDPPAGCTFVGCGCDLICDPPRCGRTICEAGTECCNASCGVCAPPGTACSSEACAPDCAAMNATGYGDCAASWGYAWDGSDCVPIHGCDCVGADCDSAFATAAACYATLSACVRHCGTIAGLRCDPSEWCDYGADPHACGGGDASGVCRPRPTHCSGSLDEVCGCDVTTYTNECLASAAGVDVAYRGACAL